MKIALVRGAFLSPYELQLYEPLTEKHEVTAIGADWQVYPYPMEFPGGYIKQAKLWGAASRILSPEAPHFINRALSWTLGQSYGLRGLAHLIGSIDILHAAESFFTMSYQCLQIKRRTSCRLVVTVSENLPYSGETHPIRRRRKKAVLREADLFVAITPTTQKMLLDEGVEASRIVIIPNSISTKRFSPGPKDPILMERLHLQEEDLVVLFAGRFVREKGLEEILTAIPGVLKAFPNRSIRFLFVGQGPLQERLIQTQHEYPEIIRIHPFVPYSEIPAFHRIADIFVMPSKPGPKINEQFGFVLAESMATAKPVITTRCGSIPDVVGEDAILIPPADAMALERALVELLNSPEKRFRLGEHARERVRTHFDAAKNAAALERHYKRLVQPS